MSTIPPRPWTGHSAILRDANGNHIADVSIFGTSVKADVVTALHIAEAVNAYDSLDAAIDAAQLKVSAAELRAEAAESRADDLAGRLRIADEEVGRLRAKLAAVGVSDV